MTDIQSATDVKLLVDTFYERVLKDELLSPFFQRLDFAHHLPNMYHFWNFVLLDEPGYTTNVTEIHSRMRLNKELFDRWVEMFSATVDDLFAGEKAGLAKQRAAIMGWTMASKFSGNK